MSEPTDFSLHGLASEIVRTSKSAEPTDLAEQLVAQIPPEHLDAALRMMARAYVRTVITTARSHAQVGPSGSWPPVVRQ